MDFKAPGVESDRLRWILLEIKTAQSTLDDAIVTAKELPRIGSSRTAQILRLNSLKREVDTSFVGLDSSISFWANNDIPTVYKTGWFMGASQTTANYDFSLPHREALEILSRDSYDDVATRLQQFNAEFGRKIDIQKRFSGLDPAQVAAIQKKGRSAVAQALLTGEADPRKVAKRLADELWEEGVTIIDAGGNHWEMDTYTRMLVRTKSANAYNSGTLNKYVEEGVSRVGVLDGVLDDSICEKANGQTWTIKYAVEHVIAHPNCRRAFTPTAGEGRVNERTVEEHVLQVEAAADKLTQLLDFGRALYEYRQSGEINIPVNDVVQFTTEFVSNRTGIPKPIAQLIIRPVMRLTFNTVDEFLEALIDPLLFAAGFIKRVPPRVELLRQHFPLTFFDELTAAVQKTNDNVVTETTTAFGTVRIRAVPGGQNLQVVELLDKVEKFVKPALDNAHYLNKSAAFYRGLRERDLVKMFKVITGEFRKVNVYGEIVDDVVGAVLQGRVVTASAFDAVRSVGREEQVKTSLEKFVSRSAATQKFVIGLRKFHKTGELDLGGTGISSTLSTVTSELVSDKLGVPQLVSEVLAARSTTAILHQASAVIESYVDPVLFSVGLIRRVSDRGVLMKIKRPRSVLDDIADTIMKSNNANFGTDQHVKVVALLETLDTASASALNAAGYFDRSAAFYTSIKNRDVVRMYLIATKELRRVNNFGIQVDGVYKAVLDGHVGDLIAEGFVSMREQVRILRVAVTDTRERMKTVLEELTVVFADLSMKRDQLRQFLEGGLASVTRPDVVDNLMRVEVPEGRLAGYTDDQVQSVLGRVESNLDEVRVQKSDAAGLLAADFGRPTAKSVEKVLEEVADDVLEEAGVVPLSKWRKAKTSEKAVGFNEEEQRMFVAHLAEVKARLKAEEAGVIPFPALKAVDDLPLAQAGGSGVSGVSGVSGFVQGVPPLTRSKIPNTGSRSGLLEPVGSKPPDTTGGRKLTYKPSDSESSPLHSTDLLTDDEMEDIVAGLVKGLEDEGSNEFNSDLLDDFAELFNRIKADGEEGPLFLELEQFLRPATFPAPEETTFEAFEKIAQYMSLFRVVDGKAQIFGDSVSAAVEQQALTDLFEALARFRPAYFGETTLWQDAIAFGDDPMLLFRHVPDADPGDLFERGRAISREFEDIRFQIGRAIDPSNVVEVRGPRLGTIQIYLEEVYGKDNVSMLAEKGSNGALFKVTDSQGRVFIVKPMTAVHGGGPGDVTMSHGLSDWLSIKLGEPTQVMHTTVVPLKNGVNQHVAVMPYFDGIQLSAAPDSLTGNSMARLELFDRIAMEADPNFGNTMVNVAQHRAVSIDTETAFGIIYHQQQVDSSIGFVGQRATHTKGALTDEWAAGRGGDLSIGFKTPDVEMYSLTKSEELFYTNGVVKPKDVKAGLVTPPAGVRPVYSRSGLPILTPDSGPRQLPVGRASMRSGGVDGIWEPVIYASPNESDVVKRLAREDYKEEIREVVAKRIQDLQERSRDDWVEIWDPGGRVGSKLSRGDAKAARLDTAIDNFTDTVSSNLSIRARSMLDDGTFNTTGGVTTHVSQDGTKYVLGELVEIVNKKTGETLSGIVMSIIDDADGVRHVTIANGMGTGKSYEELLVFFHQTPPVGYKQNGKKLVLKEHGATVRGKDEFGNGRNVDVAVEEWRGVDALLDPQSSSYADDLSKHLDSVPQRGVKSLPDDPLIAEVPIYNDNGVFVGYGRENIEIIVVNPGDGGVRFTDDLNEIFISWEQIVDDQMIEDIVESQLRGIPPSQRPRTVHVYFSPIEDADGDLAFGVMHMERREMHLSVQSATQTSTAPGANTGRIAVKVDDVLRSDEELIDGLDWRSARKVSEHEVNHAVDAGLEEAQRVTLSINIHKQLLKDNPKVKTADDLDVVAKKLIPDSYEPPRTNMSPTEQLVDFRATLVEDVENTRLVADTKSVIEDAVNNGVAKPWMQKAYNGIREGDADAHHEFFADWKSILSVDRSSRKKILDALDDPDKALSILERRALPLPDNWDPDSREFGAWLAEHLPGDVIIPRQRSAVRRYWKRNQDITGKQIAEDIIRQLDEGAKEAGGTIHLTGVVPKKGIAVARHANEETIVVRHSGEVVIHKDDLVETIQDYIDLNKKDFLRSDDWYFGYWVDKDGTLFLDVSRVVESGEVDAAHFGYRESQKSMFNLETFETIKLTDSEPDFLSWMRVRHPEISEADAMVFDTKIGAARSKFKDVKRVEDIRDSLGRLVAISTSWMPKIEVAKLKRSWTHEYRYTKQVDQPVVKKGKVQRTRDGKIKMETVDVPLRKKVTVTPKKVKENLEIVLRRAEEWFEKSIVPESLDDVSWLKRRGVTLVNQSTDAAGDDAMADLRAAFRILDDNMIARPPDGFDLVIRTPTEIRHISGKGPAPNGISVGRRTYLSTKWRNLKGTMSRDRVETIIHEVGHQLDPTGAKGRILQRAGLKSVSKYGDVSADEFFAEAFLAVMTGRASDELAEAVLELVKLDRGLVRREQSRFYVHWRDSYMLISKETGLSVGRIVANASHLSAGMNATVNHAAGVFMARMVAENHRFTGREAKAARAHFKEQIALRVAGIGQTQDASAIAKKKREIAGLRSGLRQMKTGVRLLDINSDVAGAFAVQSLAANSGEVVLMRAGNTRELTLVGRYGMPQVVRGYAVLRGSISVNDSLGDSKIRSFYNNILDPKDLYGNGDVTVDFHMGNAALRVLGLDKTNIAIPSVWGIGAGIRPLIGDTIRELFRDTDWAERLGADSPAELQEIIWEIWILGQLKENEWWGDLPRATRVPYSTLVKNGWVKKT